MKTTPPKKKVLPQAPDTPLEESGAPLSDTALAMSTHHITYVGDPDIPAMFQEIGTIRAELEHMPITHTVTGYSRLHNDFIVQHIEGPSEVIVNLHSRLINKDIYCGIIVLDEGPIPLQSLEGWSMTFRYESQPLTISALRSRRAAKQLPVHESSFASDFGAGLLSMLGKTDRS